MRSKWLRYFAGKGEGNHEGALRSMLNALFGAPRVDDSETEALESEYEELDHRQSSNQRCQSLFFMSTFALLGKMAKADGVVTEDEVEAVENYVSVELGLDAEHRALASQVFQQATLSGTSIESIFDEFAATFSSRRNLVRQLYGLLFRLAMADGSLHASERKILALARSKLTLSEETAMRLELLHAGELAMHSLLLDCLPSAELEQIHASYQAMKDAYNPKGLVEDGVPQEFANDLEKRLKSLNRAYEAMLAAAT